jgi:hypothetical protein
MVMMRIYKPEFRGATGGKMVQQYRYALVCAMLALSGCAQKGTPKDAVELQALASEGCACMQRDPQHGWWSRAGQTTGASHAACWKAFDAAVADLNVVEEPVAACGAGSESVTLTVSGRKMPSGGATLYLRYAYGACTQAESDQKRRAFEQDQAHRKRTNAPLGPSC